MPDDILGVKMTSVDTGGPLSRYGWPASCSDLQFEIADGFEGGVAGTPPYILTVAPALRTPVNITFVKSARWTVTLDHGHPFFVSVTDSKGITWSNGPLHGGAGTRACLSPPPPYPWLTLSTSLGMSFSFLILGIILASVCAWFIGFRRPVHFASMATRSPDPTHRRESKADTGTIRADTRLSQTASSRHGSASAPVARGVASPKLFSGLILRRPSNTRATSSEMGLIPGRRPTIRRAETNDNLDLAGSPTEDVQQRPFALGHESPRRMENEGAITPWTSANAVQQPAREVALGTAAPAAYPKGHFVSNSASSGPSPTAVGTSSQTPRHSSSPSGQIPIIAAPQPHLHHGSFSSTTSPMLISPPPSGMNPQLQSHEVYVVHHDAGLPPPVTVFALPGTRVTELPPGYDHILAATPRPEEATLPTTSGGGIDDGASRDPKPSLSLPLIRSTPSRPPLQTQASARSTNSGMALVHAEDVPQSAISPTSGNSLSPASPGQEHAP
ncbi:SubName: Full=Uncharacterized protein {ECO:0000313/EMBL:CCA70980.1} [Serendipita indica DSM 11827]|nr:SubName: Full=Uncharacterized protein {ECO:0000313/EMBL:CCA70980.1} [Serendipita indica DSM 11827]